LECNQGEKGVNIDQRGRVNDVYRVTTIGPKEDKPVEIQAPQGKNNNKKKSKRKRKIK
jgi:hypothetical protein